MSAHKTKSDADYNAQTFKKYGSAKSVRIIPFSGGYEVWISFN